VKPKLSEVDFKLPINMKKELMEFYVRPEIYINQLSEIKELLFTN